MKKLITIILISFLIVGCAANKKVSKKSKETNTEQETQANQTGTIVTEETQEGGSTSAEIIPIEERERDELGELKEMINEIKDGGVTQRIIYRSDGSVECECEVEDLQRKIIEMYEKEELTRIEQQEKETEKDKEESFKLSDVWIFGIFGTIVLLGGFVIFLVFKKIDTQSKVFNATLAQIVNKPV